MQRLLSFRHVVKFEETLSETRPGKPVLRIIPGNLFQRRDGFVASAFLIEAHGHLNVRPRETQANRFVPRCNFMSHGKNSQIILPCGFLA